ncbi:Inorganic phosphate transporter PHO87 [Candida viswanathii]|uniref:Inorganic phosphate transporter PHO87 n=1 Tax=Candida viswanathii TaxID=5486 RepID=A0A367XT92_9ASCO|nr:Inorganic phosphate transporter PHO87 [Candida viswanathii]
MKFSHSLKFNAVPEWQDSYVNYPTLKKTVYKLQQDQLVNNGTKEQGYTVNANQTTLSELVDNFKLTNPITTPVEGSSKKQEDAKEGNALKHRLTKNIFNKFNKKKNGSDSDIEIQEYTHNDDLEKKQVAVSSVEEYSDKTSDIRSFTGDVDNSTTGSSSNNNNSGPTVINRILENDNDDEFSDPRSLTFDPLKVFGKQLLAELEKINQFYDGKEKEILQSYDNLIKDLQNKNVDIEDVFRFTQAYYSDPEAIYTDSHHQYHITSTLSRTVTHASVFDTINHLDNDYDEELQRQRSHHDLEKQPVSEVYVHEEDSEDDDDEEIGASQDSVLLHHSDFNVKQQLKVTLKRRAVTIFINLSELKSFIELNRIGFTKICKKFDKTCGYAMKEDFINNFLPTYSRVFRAKTTEALDFKLNEIVKIYAFLTNRLSSSTTVQDLENVKTDLKSHLRDHIVFERNTVWKDLLSMEKKSYNLDLDNSAVQHNKMGDEAHIKNSMMYIQMRPIAFPKNTSIFGYDHVSLPEFFFTKQMLKIVIIVITFIILLAVKTFNDPVQGRCLAVLVACAMLWASEALPLYTTALLVPLLVVTCKVCKVTGTDEPMTATAASLYILSTMWNSTIMILIGGFTLAAALSKYNIAKIISSFILAWAGTKPRNVLLAIMCVSLFLSMWISNVAAPVLCFSLIQPVLRSIPTESPVAQMLVLGIALASDVAGMASPIASPQNVIAIESMDPNPGWGNWFAVALPVSIISVLLIWVELITTFKIKNVQLQQFKPIKDRWTVKQIFVFVVTLATILLWCVMTKIDGTFGESGIITIIPVVLFYGTGLLKVDDLNNYPWSIVLLAMGGIALGKAVTSSGLLKTIAMALQRRIMNYDAFVVLLIFGVLILVVATFVSHTVSALIIVPLVKEVGDSLPTPHPRMLIMGVALIALGAMGLPTSGFPNVTAIGMRDEVGKPYVTVNSFITRGVPASLIVYLCVITIGYGVMSSLGF